MTHDAPVRYSIYHEQRNPVDNEPQSRDVIIFDGMDTMRVHFSAFGPTRLNIVEGATMRLDAGFFDALLQTGNAWKQDRQEWEELQKKPTPNRPAQAQVLALIQDYKDGLFDLNEFVQVLREIVEDERERKQAVGPTQDHEPEENVCGFHGCINPRKSGYSWCEEHIDAALDEEYNALSARQATREAADNAEQLPDIPNELHLDTRDEDMDREEGEPADEYIHTYP